MALPFRTPPETGLSGPVRAVGAAGASPSAFTAGPAASGTFTEEAAGAGALAVTPLSNEATRSGAAALRAGVGAGCAAVGLEGLGCGAAAAVALLAGALGGFEAGCGCGLAAACAAGAAGAAGCDIFA